MSSLVALIAFVLATASIFFIKHRLSGFFAAAATLLSLLPFLEKINSLLALLIISLFLCFCVAELNQELWGRLKFKAIKTTRFMLVLVALSLTVGVSVAVWWWQGSASLSFEFGEIMHNWWKSIATMIITLNFLVKLGEAKKPLDKNNE